MAQKSKLQQLHDAFTAADTDGDGLLNKAEFVKFVEIGYQKQCPASMYDSICARFNCDANVGISWDTANNLSAHANKPGSKPKKPAPISTATTTVATSDIAKNPRFSPTTSTHSGDSASTSATFIEAVTPLSCFLDADDQTTTTTSTTTTSTTCHSHHSHARSQSHTVRTPRRFGSYSRLERLPSTPIAVASSPVVVDSDAQSMVVDILEGKTKQLHSTLVQERAKRKRTEEIAQRILDENETYKKETQELRARQTHSHEESKRLHQQLHRLQQQMEDDSHVIRHLQQQRTAMKSERDEAFALLSKLEKEHASYVQKLKAKHCAELDTLTTGLLHTLGAQPGRDVYGATKTLKAENAHLKDTVDTLAESLSRKQQSLMEALQAVDNVCAAERNARYAAGTSGATAVAVSSTSMINIQRLRHRLQQWNANTKSTFLRRRRRRHRHRRGSTGNLRHASTLQRDSDSDDEDEDEYEEGDEEEDEEDGEQLLNLNEVGIPWNHLSAAWFKQQIMDVPNGHADAAQLKQTKSQSNLGVRGPQNKSNASTSKQVKEMQFLSQKLCQDVAKKQESIEQLEMANAALMQQLQNLK